jgi:predicted nucleotidyltransferase
MPGASVEEAVREAARQQPGLRLVVWFGSTARGDATPGSDVDLGVLGGDGAALAAEVSRAVGREVDLVSLEGELPVPLLEALVRDGRVIWRADATAEGAWRARAVADLELRRPGWRRMRDAWLARVASRGLP